MRRRRRASYQTVAWSLGLVAATLIAVGLWGSAADGFFGLVQTVYFTTGLYAIVGAMIAARQPRNSVGWLMIVMALITAVSMAPFDLGYWIVASRIEPRQLGVAFLWIGSWLWILPFGMGLPLILGRFPSGRGGSESKVIDALSAAGTVVFALAMAFRPGPIYPLGLISNPFGQAGQAQAITVMSALGLLLLLAGYGLSLISVGRRLLAARGDERQQLKWVVASSGLVVASLAIGVAAQIAYQTPLLPAIVPLSVSSLTLPIAFGVAILRYRLYDLDIIINKAFVYLGLTAILAGLYTVVIALSQRLFIAYTGQRSDAALLVTAFVEAAAFTPVRDSLQRIANRRLALRDPTAALRRLASSIEVVVNVLDTERIARRVVRDAIDLFEAEGAELYLDHHDPSQPFHAVGRVDGGEVVVAVHAGSRVVGRLVLGHRRGDAAYSSREMAALQSAADALGEAVALARDSQGQVTAEGVPYYRTTDLSRRRRVPTRVDARSAFRARAARRSRPRGLAGRRRQAARPTTAGQN